MYIVLILAVFFGAPLLLLCKYWLMANQGNIVELILILVLLIGFILIFKDQLTAMINDWFRIFVSRLGVT